MTTRFNSVDDAKKMMACYAGIDVNVIEGVSGLHVAGMDSFLLDDPSTSDEIKNEIRERLNLQKGFKFKALDGVEVKFVVCPFRDGFDCWIVGEGGICSLI